jgi:hypothetical protein
MNAQPNYRLSILREKIAKQRNTVAMLRREGHIYTDAERQLTELTAELARSEGAILRSA